MGATVYCFNFLNFSSWFLLLIEVPTGIVLYIVLAKLFKIDSLLYVVNVAKSYLKRNKKVEEKTNDTL